MFMNLFSWLCGILAFTLAVILCPQRGTETIQHSDAEMALLRTVKYIEEKTTTANNVLILELVPSKGKNVTIVSTSAFRFIYTPCFENVEDFLLLLQCLICNTFNVISNEITVCHCFVLFF